MEKILSAKNICLERDAHRCRHCGTAENIEAYQLHEREGRLAWQLSNLVSLCKDCRHDAAYNIKERMADNKCGVILCGGRGTRLNPTTQFQNKHTLPIGILPMLFYPLKTLRSLGVYRVLIVVDRNGADQIVKMLGSGKEFGMDISYKIQEGAGGIAEALYLAKDFVNTEDEIYCILGDNIFDNNDMSFGVDLQYDESGESKYKACVFLKKVPNPEDYGVAVLGDDGSVAQIIEKPKKFISDMGVVGLYVYKYDVFGVIEKVDPSERGELEISSVNNHYASKNELLYKIVSGYWGDAGGSIQRYAECSMHGAKKANVSAEEIDNFRSIVFDDK